MASKRSFSEEDFSCPVCNDIFKDPVLLNCSHSVCKVCLKQFWDTKVHRECPVCRRRSAKLYPPSNLALKNLSETFRLEKSQRDSEQLCSLHNEKFKLFCLDDKQPVCLVCRDSKEHMNHKFRPIDEVTPEYKEELNEDLDYLKRMLKKSTRTHQTCVDIEQQIKTQAQHTERQIKKVFGKLHQFLHDEEAARIAALKEEEEQKSQMMKETTRHKKIQISLISDTIRDVEEVMAADDVTFLQKYNSTKENAWVQLGPTGISGALIDVAKHLGNLMFSVWEKMQKIVQYTPVTLDPNTAHSSLILSDDLTSVRYIPDNNKDHDDNREENHGSGSAEGIVDDNKGSCVKRQKLPNNPERFKSCACVLGSVGFNSGTPCWDVEVGDNKDWCVGVMTKSALRKGAYDNVENVELCMYYFDGKYRTFTTLQPIVKQKPQRIRVQLDWDRGELTFSDSDTYTHLHTIRHAFTETVLPYFNVDCELFPLKILPVKASVRIEQRR